MKKTIFISSTYKTGLIKLEIETFSIIQNLKSPFQTGNKGILNYCSGESTKFRVLQNTLTQLSL